MSGQRALALAALVLLMRPSTAPAASAVVRSPALLQNGNRNTVCRLTNLDSVARNYTLHGEPSSSLNCSSSGSLAAGNSVEIACSTYSGDSHCEANADSNTIANSFLVTLEFKDQTSGVTLSAVASRGNAVPTLFSGKTVTGSLSAAGFWGIACAAVNAGTASLSASVSVVDDSGAVQCSASGTPNPGDVVWVYCTPNYQTTARCTANSDSNTNTRLLVISAAVLGSDFASRAALPGL